MIYILINSLTKSQYCEYIEVLGFFIESQKKAIEEKYSTSSLYEVRYLMMHSCV